MHAPAEPRARRAPTGMLARLGRDSAYVLPGLFVAVASFAVLLTLFTVGMATMAVWVGVLVLPLALVVASGFADVSRARLRAWGSDVDPVRYQRRDPGLAGWLRLLSDPRRWLDLLFECVIAFPLRVVTFTVAVSWWALTLGGLTYAVWGFSIPDPEPWPQRFLTAVTGGAIAPELASSYLMHVLVCFVIGLIGLVTLPLVMRGLAALDAVVTRAALTGVPGAVDSSAGALPGVDSARGSADAGGGAGMPSAAVRKPGAGDAPGGETANRAERDGGLVTSSVSPEGWAWIAAGVISVLSLSIGWPVLAAADGIPAALAMLIALVQAGAALLGVRWAWAAIAVTAVAMFNATFLIAMVGTAGAFPVPVVVMLMHFLVLALVTLRHGWLRGAALWAVSVAAPVGAVAVLGATAGQMREAMSHLVSGGALANLIVVASVGGGLLAMASAARQLVLGRASLRRERAVSAEEAAKRREIEERNRIAQELHDVVAHSMSVISVQATTAQYRIEGLDARVRGEFDSIAESSRGALTEMRGLLSLLRTDREAALAPQPELKDLEQLVEATRRSGATIEFDAAGLAELAAAVPSTTGLTAYRIVQEGLSNAVRHAPGADVRVELARESEQLRITVVNGAPARELSVAPSPGSGLGLSGLRARAGALGGTLSAGPEGDGGFRLEATLPIG